MTTPALTLTPPTTATGPAATPSIKHRRAIEALRAGVPSADAVALLGSGQSEIEDKFLELLGAARAGTAGGMLIGGGFGSGKSHLLEHLTQLALAEGYAVSRVVVSKETPLHDQVKVFRAAAEAAIVAEGKGPAIPEAAARLDVQNAAYAELLRWAVSPAAGLNERFAASLVLYAKTRERDPELADDLVRFWCGDPLSVSQLRRGLKDAGEARTALSPVSVKTLGEQRLRFATRLLAAAGCAGWLVLFDEVELIGRYSVLQRARSYARIARWIRGKHDAPGLPLAAVLAMTDDFEAAVVTGKRDKDTIPVKLRASTAADSADLATDAVLGMRIIDREMTLLTPPDAVELDRTYQQLKQVHGAAFGWSPPEVEGLERLGATRMRQYIRAWINEWDLVRLDSGFRPQTIAVDVESDYREDTDLEGGAVDESEDG
ncbi:MAG TPA: BREX system ATP-binding domain-containing protein [Actinocrinis sp.]|jgi:hypothetical protein